MRTVIIRDNRVTGARVRRVDPEATNRVLREALDAMPEGVELIAARAALQSVPPCRCNRARQADPVDAVRWMADVAACQGRLREATVAYNAARVALLPTHMQVFGLREGEVESDTLADAFDALRPGELLRPDGTVEIDTAAAEAAERRAAAVERERRRIEYLDQRIAEMDAGR